MGFLFFFFNKIFSTVNTAFVRAMYKKGLGMINKEKTREIQRFARIEILVRQ